MLIIVILKILILLITIKTDCTRAGRLGSDCSARITRRCRSPYETPLENVISSCYTCACVSRTLVHVIYIYIYIYIYSWHVHVLFVCYDDVFMLLYDMCMCFLFYSFLWDAFGECHAVARHNMINQWNRNPRPQLEPQIFSLETDNIYSVWLDTPAY